MLRKAIFYFSAVFLGLLLGLSSAIWAVKEPSGKDWIANGPWRINLLAGSEASGVYDRATIALSALFALKQSEALYFVAFTDEEGNRLEGRCDYRVVGSDPDARWWSITAYAEDRFLIPNGKNIYSFNKNNIARDDEKFSISLSQHEKEGDWIPLGSVEEFFIALRLYNPASHIYDQAGSIDLPTIIKGECR